MKYDIYLSDMERKTVLQLPVLPEEMPNLPRSSNNEEFPTFSNGTYNIIGDVGLITFNLESFLPAKGRNYPFQRVKNVDPEKYLQLITGVMVKKKPLRVLIVRGDGTFVLNDTFSVDSFDPHEDKIGNYQYSITFKQWRDYNV